MPKTKPDYVADNFIVALDFDGCIALGHNVKIKYAKLQYGIDVRPDQTEGESFPDAAGMKGKQAYKKLMQEEPINIQVKHTLEFELAPDCKQVLTRLFGQGFRFVIVTSRTKPELAVAKEFIKMHGLPIDYFHNTAEGSKEEFIDRLHARAMIDDSIEKLIPLEETTLASLYFLRQPWNLNRKVPRGSNIIEISTWNDFYDQMILLKQLHEAVAYTLKIKNQWTQIRQIQAAILKDSSQAMKWHKNYMRTAA